MRATEQKAPREVGQLCMGNGSKSGEEGYGEVEIPRAGGPITALGGGILRSRFTARGIRRKWMSYWCSLNAR